MRAPNVFTISPALPFLETFVAALLRGEVVPGATDGGPLALARMTIFVPTRRAARALADTLLAQASTASVLLPRILPLGALEATETDLLFAEPDLVDPPPPAAGAIWRRLHLATLIQAWSRALAGAIRSVDANGHPVVDAGESFRVAVSAVDAVALAGELAGLIDELAIEGVAWHALDDLDMAGFDDYWRITTTFLQIAFEQWPRTLDEAGLIDPAARRIRLIEAQARMFAEPDAGPVIAIGSTGTNKATARLLADIARAAHGAVVLPGLDLDLDDAAFALAGGTRRDGQEPSFGHPQAAMARLLPVMGIARTDVRPLGAPAPEAALRVRFIAEALRPADTTDVWRQWRRATSTKALAPALDGLCLVEAADEREEALCLAIALREIVETPGRTAALVTPDRELGRRVRGELLRWAIEVDDSAGTPLAASPLGLVARLAVEAAAKIDARTALALLAHPLVTFGRGRNEVARLTALLDIGVLRAVGLDGKAPAAIFAEARSAAADRHAHPAQRAIAPADWTAMARLWDELSAALAPLSALKGETTLDRWVSAHRDVVDALVGSAAAEEAELVDGLFDELAASGPSRLDFDAEAYGVLFGRLAGEVVLPNTRTPHPRLQILGLLEARLIRADVMLLGGLDEGVWPPQPSADPFLNRPMRAALGLLPPERRIGQTAHDFAQALGAQTVVLSRARKRAGSPCVPSRFLLRLEALAGKGWEPVRARGERYVRLAAALDRPLAASVPVTRPRPTPPVALRPTRLSVTEIETLRRDPYAIYAMKVLRLAPLPRRGGVADAGEFGSLMHDALHAFVADGVDGPIEARRARLRTIVATALGPMLEDASFKAFRWPNVLKALDTFLSFDEAQRATLDVADVELSGQLDIDLADLSRFTLTARADRIDRHRDGRATLVDYKTGQPPGLREVRVGFAPQLTLEAAILSAGGFGVPPSGEIDAVYLKLGGKDGGRRIDISFDDEPFMDVVERHFVGAKRLLSAFRNIETAYPSRPFPKYARRYGDYDHLARVREWSLASDEEVAP